MDASFRRIGTRDLDVRKFLAAKDDRTFINESRSIRESDECFENFLGGVSRNPPNPAACQLRLNLIRTNPRPSKIAPKH